MTNKSQVTMKKVSPNAEWVKNTKYIQLVMEKNTFTGDSKIVGKVS